MDEQTSERFIAVEGRVTAMETEVAVIQSNYVRKDETADRHAVLRDELAAIRHANQRACDENRALIERWRVESKADTAASEARCLAAVAAVKASNEASIAEVKASNQASIAEVKASNEASIAEVRHDVTKMGLRIIMWMFAMLTAHSALLLAVLKGMR